MPATLSRARRSKRVCAAAATPQSTPTITNPVTASARCPLWPRASVTTRLAPLPAGNLPPFVDPRPDRVNETIGDVRRIAAGAKRIRPLASAQAADQLARPPQIVDRDAARQFGVPTAVAE